MITAERRDLDLRDTFECGQCFRWEREKDGSYTGIAGGFAANIRTSEDTVYIDGEGSGEFWRTYLDLDRDYISIKEFLSSRDGKIRDAIDNGVGIHILSQDSWETIISFIISQNNNIPRIKKCISALCERFGSFAGICRGRRMYSFPDKETLAAADEEDLADIRLGYRAAYIVKTSRADFDPACEMSREELLALPGIGPKVADCIRLFGYGDVASFPIDVWVRRVMNRVYGFDEKDLKGMHDFAAERFGEYGGIAQQYLFNSIKNH